MLFGLIAYFQGWMYLYGKSSSFEGSVQFAFPFLPFLSASLLPSSSLPFLPLFLSISPLILPPFPISFPFFLSSSPLPSLLPSFISSFLPLTSPLLSFLPSSDPRIHPRVPVCIREVLYYPAISLSPSLCLIRTNDPGEVILVNSKPQYLSSTKWKIWKPPVFLQSC